MFPWIVFLISLFPLSANTAEVTLTFEQVRNGKGTLRLAVFKDDESFQKERITTYFLISKSDLVQGKITHTIELPAGKCGLSVLDDENNDQVMNYNWLGIPLEGFGFSNFEHTGFSKPHYEDFEVNIVSGSPNKITLKMRYL